MLPNISVAQGPHKQVTKNKKQPLKYQWTIDSEWPDSNERLNSQWYSRYASGILRLYVWIRWVENLFLCLSLFKDWFWNYELRAKKKKINKY